MHNSHYIHSILIYHTIFITHGYIITTQKKEQHPVGMLAQLVEHCNSIAEVVGWNLFQASFSLLLK